MNTITRSATKEKAIKDAAHELGLETLKPKQRDAIVSFLSGNDILVVLPNGYEKSLLFTQTCCLKRFQAQYTGLHP